MQLYISTEYINQETHEMYKSEHKVGSGPLRCGIHSGHLFLRKHRVMLPRILFWTEISKQLLTAQPVRQAGPRPADAATRRARLTGSARRSRVEQRRSSCLCCRVGRQL